WEAAGGTASGEAPHSRVGEWGASACQQPAGVGSADRDQEVPKWVPVTVILTSSTAASTRLAPAASAASIRIRTDWPAYGVRSTCSVRQLAARLLAAPVCWNTVVVPPACTIRTRK